MRGRKGERDKNMQRQRHGTISITRGRVRGRGKRGGEEEETDSWTDKEMDKCTDWQTDRDNETKIQRE